MTKTKAYSFFGSLVAFLAIVLVANCGQDFNSNSGDENLGGGKVVAGACDGEAGARRCAAVAVLRPKCFGCHAGLATNSTDEDWQNNKDALTGSEFVVKGKPLSSRAIKSLINEGGKMPQGGSALPTSEYQAIYTWIEKMQ